VVDNCPTACHVKHISRPRGPSRLTSGARGERHRLLHCGRGLLLRSYRDQTELGPRPILLLRGTVGEELGRTVAIGCLSNVVGTTLRLVVAQMPVHRAFLAAMAAPLVATAVTFRTVHHAAILLTEPGA
jgi:hypothetical protein